MYFHVTENIGLTLRARLKSQVILHDEKDDGRIDKEHLVRIEQIFSCYMSFWP